MNDTPKVTIPLNRVGETRNKVRFEDGRGNTQYLFHADDVILGKPDSIVLTITPA